MYYTRPSTIGSILSGLQHHCNEHVQQYSLVLHSPQQLPLSRGLCDIPPGYFTCSSPYPKTQKSNSSKHVAQRCTYAPWLVSKHKRHPLSRTFILSWVSPGLRTSWAMRLLENLALNFIQSLTLAWRRKAWYWYGTITGKGRVEVLTWRRWFKGL